MKFLLILLLLALPALVEAQFSFETNADNTITITGYNGSDGEVIIPGSTNSLPVTGIEDWAFFFANMTNVFIPESITNIGDNAFAACTNLTMFTVDTRNSFYSSIDGVLFDQNQLVIIRFPQCKGGSYSILDGVTNVGDKAFGGCLNLTSVMIPGSVGSIGAGGFGGCGNLTNVIIQNGIIRIGVDAFALCSNLTSIHIPDSVTSIDGGAFYGCYRLACILIPNSITNIGENAFASCFGLTNISLPNNITELSDYMFVNCTNLITISIPASITSIEEGLFSYCLNLKEVLFYGDAPILGEFVFYQVPPNTTVYYLPGTTGWDDFFTQSGQPNALWLPRMQMSGKHFGVKANQFGFNINWASGQTVIVDACTDMSNPQWQPVQTNTLTDGSAYFSDPQWANFPNRFYRLRSP